MIEMCDICGAELTDSTAIRVMHPDGYVLITMCISCLNRYSAENNLGNCIVEEE